MQQRASYRTDLSKTIAPLPNLNAPTKKITNQQTYVVYIYICVCLYIYIYGIHVQVIGEKKLTTGKQATHH